MLLLLLLLLIILEKLSMLPLLLSQKLERFYKSVVEEALLGKDPDVAEDFTGKNKIADSKHATHTPIAHIQLI